jgi:transposase
MQPERESHRNAEVICPIKHHSPDFKTIADFRRHNRGCIRQACRGFALFCRKLDIFSENLVAVDGSK